MTKPIPFSDTEVNSVLDQMSEKLKDDVTQQVIRPISLALEQLQEIYAHLLLLPEVKTVTMRTDTLQSILSNFEAEISDRYPPVLEKAGRSIGRSFAEDFVQTLRSIKRIPVSMKALMSFWLEIESRAHWGDFDIRQFKQDKVTISVKDFFLTRGLSDHIHRNCSFMEGYIESFLWEATKTCSRWYQSEYGTLATNRFPEPISVKDIPFGDRCRFVISLKKEELTEAFNELYQAKDLFSTDKHRSVAVSIRAALEMAFKSKIGIDASKQAPVTSIIRAFRDLDLLPSLSYQTIKDVYGRSSAIIHKSVPATRETSTLIIRDTEEVLRVLELTSLTEKKKKELLDSLRAR